MIIRSGSAGAVPALNPLDGCVHACRGPSGSSSKNISSSAGEENSSRRSPQPSRRLSCWKCGQPFRPLPFRWRRAHHDDLHVGRVVECRELAHHRPHQRSSLFDAADDAIPGNRCSQITFGIPSMYSWSMRNFRSACPVAGSRSAAGAISRLLQRHRQLHLADADPYHREHVAARRPVPLSHRTRDARPNLVGPNGKSSGVPTGACAGRRPPRASRPGWKTTSGAAAVSSPHDILRAAPRLRTIRPIAENAAIPPNRPKPPASWRAPDTYMTTISPTTPQTRPTGSTTPQILRGGGIGATIAASSFTLPPPVWGGCSGSPGRTKVCVVTKTTLLAPANPYLR